ncbi:deoxyguanosinetriphosphate triphosphohydrolase [Alicyclobacillus contaminans]|uniref:deoxyguanosinetriphosphate triphosphohydrolase family protein n=1 Tax=Alicyclobacillus contaminans TaxID=392016 RepID=UPI0004193C7D|nr:dNTP triphosphohydrolase [Alicyclobacillus contaminans]GMA49332.1 deoxyguanosinetriphosphate triphosphohydrolase [Alicyclobacillus contaminans]
MGREINIDALLEAGLEIADPYNEVHTKRVHETDPFITGKADNDSRDAFERDYARVIHSASFRRLQGKMQLLGTQTSDYYRTRLTHSLEVSQIGTEIATKINSKHMKRPVSKALVAMACLAHDLGNPPFGHYGEKVLNYLMQNYGGFEGNAQTLPIVCDLERKSEKYNGLNLTLASRVALVKYNVTAQAKKDKRSLAEGKFIYTEHEEIVRGTGGMKPQSLECQIMELSDDIAYACHDLEDSLKSGILSLEDVKWYIAHHSDNPKNTLHQFDEILKIASDFSGDSHGDTFHKSITSVLINKFVNDVQVVPYSKEELAKKGTEFKQGLGLCEYRELVKQLKKAVYELLVSRPDVAEEEIKGGIMLKRLFEMLVDERYNYKLRLFPLEYQLLINKVKDKEQRKGAIYRAACDYIAGMTDAFAIKLYKKHFGGELPSYSDCDWADALK